ncbi:hypothetical protein [Prosthecomicrobium sp. N25]|uniref:hypothetical protein n=1 Tax=Prosthecomicrobium sp. N25 TaxID=3129254 RepID=UPI003077DA4C
MTWKLAAAVVALAPLAITPAAAATGQSCKSFTEAEVKERFDRWNASLASGSADAVTLWYTPDAKVHLALKDKPAADQKALRAFYEGAMIKGVKVELKDRKITLGCNTATDQGRLVYRVGNETVTADYRKVYENRDGVFLLKEHTSTRVQ